MKTLLALLFPILAAAASPKPPSAGSKAPAFTLNSQEGKPVSLADFKGRWVVLYFYPKDFTKGCTIEAHNFQRDLKKYEARKAVIVGVSVQSAESHEEFCEKEGLDFKLLADTDRKVTELYGSVLNLAVVKLSARKTFLIDPKGIIAKEWLDVKPQGHSEEVLSALDALQAPKKR